MRDNNILVRFIKPAALTLGIGFVNWRCLRTSYATWLIEAGANPKKVQGQVRHSRIATTMDVYGISDFARVPFTRKRSLANASGQQCRLTPEPFPRAAKATGAVPACKAPFRRERETPDGSAKLRH